MKLDKYTGKTIQSFKIDFKDFSDWYRWKERGREGDLDNFHYGVVIEFTDGSKIEIAGEHDEVVSFTEVREEILG